jgi:hypothetical protein
LRLEFPNAHTIAFGISGCEHDCVWNFRIQNDCVWNAIVSPFLKKNRQEVGPKSSPGTMKIEEKSMKIEGKSSILLRGRPGTPPRPPGVCGTLLWHLSRHPTATSRTAPGTPKASQERPQSAKGMPRRARGPQNRSENGSGSAHAALLRAFCGERRS